MNHNNFKLRNLRLQNILSNPKKEFVNNLVNSDTILFAEVSNGNIYVPYNHIGSERFMIKITDEPKWTNVTVGSVCSGYMLAVATDGTLHGIGKGEIGELCEHDDTLYKFTEIPTDVSWHNVLSGVNYVLALSKERKVYHWGSLYTEPSTILRQPTKINDYMWDILSMGDRHVVGISGGKLYGWGSNGVGQLGMDDDILSVSEPTQIGTDDSWCDVYCGHFHTIAIKKDGTMWGCGANASKQLIPAPIHTLIGLTQLNLRTDWVSVTSMGELDTSTTVGRTKANDEEDYPIFVWGNNVSNITEDLTDSLSDTIIPLEHVYSGLPYDADMSISGSLSLVREHKNKLT